MIVNMDFTYRTWGFFFNETETSRWTMSQNQIALFQSMWINSDTRRYGPSYWTRLCKCRVHLSLRVWSMRISGLLLFLFTSTLYICISPYIISTCTLTKAGLACTFLCTVLKCLYRTINRTINHCFPQTMWHENSFKRSTCLALDHKLKYRYTNIGWPLTIVNIIVRVAQNRNFNQIPHFVWVGLNLLIFLTDIFFCCQGSRGNLKKHLQEKTGPCLQSTRPGEHVQVSDWRFGNQASLDGSTNSATGAPAVQSKWIIDPTERWPRGSTWYV